jgi:Asp-tRNA(Asn)/Glu-tRNA(Gln) amidotransferase A subunit family amidase
VISLAEIYAYHSGQLEKSYENYGMNIRKRMETGQFIPAWTYINALRFRQQNMMTWEEVYRKIDLSPMMAIPAHRIDARTITLGGKEVDPRDLAVSSRTSPSNFNGYPAISYPVVLRSSSSQGRPFEIDCGLGGIICGCSIFEGFIYRYMWQEAACGIGGTIRKVCG